MFVSSFGSVDKPLAHHRSGRPGSNVATRLSAVHQSTIWSFTDEISTMLEL